MKEQSLLTRTYLGKATCRCFCGLQRSTSCAALLVGQSAAVA